MSSESIRASRIARYSLAATAAAATGMADLTVHADVTSGSFSISFGRTSGTNFFNGFNSEYGGRFLSAVMGDWKLHLTAYQGTDIADANFTMTVSSSSASAQFVVNPEAISTSISSASVYVAQQVGAGQVWNGNTASMTVFALNQIFFTYKAPNGDRDTWTNPDANGTKYLNFRIEDGGAFTYGWIQLDWNITDANDWSVAISNWAYTSDGPLAAGDTGGSQAVPGLGGLAALAVGAAGLRGRRQRMAG